MQIYTCLTYVQVEASLADPCIRNVEIRTSSLQLITLGLHTPGLMNCRFICPHYNVENRGLDMYKVCLLTARCASGAEVILNLASQLTSSSDAPDFIVQSPSTVRLVSQSPTTTIYEIRRGAVC